MGQSWTAKVRRVGILCAVNLSLYLNCFAGVDQGEKKVTLNVVEESCVKVFKQIEKQTKMSFFYSTSDIRLPGKVSIKVVDAALDEVMGRILEGTNLEWVYTYNVITIRKKKGLAGGGNGTGTVADSNINMITVTGKVTQADGTGIPGATVRVKRTGDGVTTDGEGSFTIANTKKNDKLTISSIGYETREVAIYGESILIKLNIAVSDLDETVVMAYGTTTKRYNTGNISTVRSEDIEKQPTSNPLLAVQGRVPGVVITQSTGVPGSRVSILIRGQNSISNGNDPLFVIDGVPYNSQLLPGVGGSILGSDAQGRAGSPFSFINPADIESIDILKDADATAIYGSRGANGVVLITTRKGKAGKMRVNINSYTGLGQITRRMKLFNSSEYLRMRHEALKNDDVAPGSGDYDLNGSWDTTHNTDWQDALIGGTANLVDIQTSISGGNIHTQYVIGSGYHRETTVFPKSFADHKASVHFNITSSSLNDKFNITLTGNYTNNSNNLPTTDLTSQIFTSPVAPQIYNSDGTLNWQNSTWANPFASLLNKYQSSTNSLVANSVLRYQILPGLEFKSSFGFTNMAVTEINSSTIAALNPRTIDKKGSSAFTNNRISSWIIEPQISYMKKVSKGILNILVGSTIQQNLNKGTILNGTGYTSDAQLENIQSSSQITVLSSTYTRYKYNALFTRLNYNYDSKYILNLTGRRDGTSRFGPRKQFADFGSAGFAWIFTNEAFAANVLPFLSFGKIRGSYGTSGNDQVGDYSFLDLYGPTTYTYQNTPGLSPLRFYNPLLAWEVNKKLETGIDIGLLKDRILFTASFYWNRSGNQLVRYPLPNFTGFNFISKNLPARVLNKGVELTLNTINIKTSKIYWTTNINLTIPTNRLLEFPNLENTTYSNSLVIGSSLSTQKVYELKSIDSETGMFIFKDSTNKGTPIPSPTTDRSGIINTDPKIYGGIQNSVHFGNFELDILFQFVKQKGRIYKTNPSYAPGIFAVGGNQPKEALYRWQNIGDNAKIAKYTQDPSSIVYYSYSYIAESDFIYGDASFIRLKNLSISYLIPDTWKRKLYVENCRIYLQGQNLLTFTKYKGLDPENQSITNLPPLTVMTAGVKFNF